MKHLLFYLFSFSLLANQDCNVKFVPKPKLCPDSGATLVDETYPRTAHIISLGKNFNANERKHKMPVDFALSVLESYNFDNGSPNIIIPSEEKEFSLFVKALEDKVKKSNGKIPVSVLEKVKRAPGNNYTWQRDYFKSAIDLNSGGPSLRFLEAYQDNTRNLDLDRNIISITAAAGCGANKGEFLKTHRDNYSKLSYEEYSQLSIEEMRQFNKEFGGEDNYAAASAEYGGNMVGLPGGLCLAGNNVKKDFLKQLCGSEENLVQVDADWLKVGHVDEFLKVIPTNKKGVPDQCQFTIMTASPEKALELLNLPKNQSQSFLSTFDGFEDKSDENFEEFVEGITYYDMYKNDIEPHAPELCKLIESIDIDEKGNTKSNSESGATQAWLKLFLKFDQLILSQAFAAASRVGGRSCSDILPKVNNRQFHDAIMGDEDLLKYNKAIQNSINHSKELMRDKILERLPECGKYLDFVDVPNLFYGGYVVDEEDGGFRLPKEGGTGGSFFPNPTNSVTANKTVIFPDPHNNAFRNYLDDEMKNLGLKNKYLDTWEATHIYGGNLHCATNSLPVCTPRGN